ncbi:MAG: D-alanine--D-alanine ligase, partial [Clostridiales bacterium]|nr:D-alanine--D-alanine ligase [Clostridiales bacterium]
MKRATKTVAILFGGRSCEHDVSVITATQVAAALPHGFSGLPVYIDRNGRFGVGKRGASPKDVARKKRTKSCFFRPDSPLLHIGARKIRIDCALLCLHGGGGEDGSVQGYLELAGVPYTSPGVAPSAIGMDKIACKLWLKGLGVHVAPGAWFDKAEFSTESDCKKVIERLERLKYPLIVKPATQGSSIGIAVAQEREGLFAALEVALQFDNRILVEHVLPRAADINCSVVGQGGQATASVCEKPVKWEEILSFEDKYLRPQKGKAQKGGKGLEGRLPAPLAPAQTQEIQDTAKKIFLNLGCKGVIRIDFLVDEAGKVYVNELNTIPGSLSGYLWAFEGKPLPSL